MHRQRAIIEGVLSAEVRSTNWSQTTKSPGAMWWLEATRRAGAENSLDAEIPHRPHIRPVVHSVGRVAMSDAVPWHECHSTPANLADRDPIARVTVRRIDSPFLSMLQQAVEA